MKKETLVNMAGIMAFLIIMTLGIVIIDKRIEIMGDVNPSYALEK